VGGLSCSSGQVAKWNGTIWACAADQDSGGDITGVSAGAGLTGGGSAGSVTLGVQFGGSGMAVAASRADHDHFGATWSGNGPFGLQVQNSFTAPALLGSSTATSGVAYGVRGEAVSPSGYGGFFTNLGGGAALRLGLGALVFADLTSQTTAAVNPAADITGVSAGTGLQGGGTSGDVSLAVNFAGSGTAPTASRTDHSHFGVAWSGSGASGFGLMVQNTSGTGLRGISTATAGAAYGVWGESASTDAAGVLGHATSSSGFGIGVLGASSATSGRGVVGLATPTDGFTEGVRGESDSSSGRGVAGFATATTGPTSGVHGQASSSSGRGVYGVSFATSGAAPGVQGQTSSTQGHGVYGVAVATGGSATGVRGETSSSAGYGGYFANFGGGAALRLGQGALQFADGTSQATAPANPAADITGVAAGTGLAGGGTSGDVSLAVSFGGSGAAATVSRSDHDHFGGTWTGTTANGLTVTTTNGAAGRAIYGEATAAAGTNWGVWGQTGSSEGRGVYGRATSTVGVNYGVFGETASATGSAVHGLATRTVGANYGVRGETASNQGRGVQGLATATSGTTYGVYGESASSSGAGVRGMGAFYGVVGEVVDPQGFGLYTTRSASVGALRVEGNTLGFPLVVIGQTVSPGVFNRMGSDGVVIRIQRDGFDEGTISVAGNIVSYNAFTGSHYAWAEEPVERGMLVSLTGRNLRHHDREGGEPIHGVALTTAANDPRVLGAYLARQEPDDTTEPVTENPHLVVAVGNGVMWVADAGEDIEPGDRLISADVPGHARKDDPRLPVSYVVARAVEAVRWFEVDEDAAGVKRRLVPVLFEPGVVERAGGLAHRVAEQADEIRALRARLDALEARLGPN
jgi:hypothetical protein